MGCKVTFLYFLLLAANFTQNSWWHNEVYLVVYSKFAPHRRQSLSPWQRRTTWRISKHSARSENHTKPINRFRGQNPGILFSNTWKHGRTVTASRYIDCLLFHSVHFNDHFRRKSTRVSAHIRLHRRRKNQRMTQVKMLFTFSSTCFGHHYAHRQETDWIKPRLMLAWMCWLR